MNKLLSNLKNKKFYKFLLKIFLFFLVFLTFFYTFWFSLSEEKVRDFILKNKILGESITITQIKKNWCSIDIENLKLNALFIPKIKFRFCSLSFLFLRGIPISFFFEEGKIQTTFPLLSSKSEVNIDSNFAWNELPFIGEYIPAKENPTYSLKVEYSKNLVEGAVIDLSLQNFFLDKKKVQHPLIKPFIPDNINFDDLILNLDITPQLVRLNLKTKGIFTGNVIGIINIKPNLFDSKIAIKIAGRIKNAEQLGSIINLYLKPYLRNDALQLELGGTLQSPQPKNLANKK